MSGEFPADPTGRQGFGNMMSMGRDLGTGQEEGENGTERERKWDGNRSRTEWEREGNGTGRGQ